MSNRLDKEREKELTPERVYYAMNRLVDFKPEYIEKERMIRFYFKDKKVCFFPYSGWHSGKSIKDGRGIENLIKQLK